MTEKELNNLLKKYTDGEVTGKESKRIDMFFDRLLTNQENQDHVIIAENTKAGIYKEIQNQISLEESTKNRKKSITTRIAANLLKVAAVVALAALGIAFYQNSTTPPPAETPTANLITKSTNVGQMRTVTLADGTRIKLNAGSTIIYPEKFANTREVVLQGEAYFEVAEDANRPFVVTTGKVTTTALGTSFNIKSYPTARQTNISLIEGKVRIDKYADDDKTRKSSAEFLLPGENILYDQKSSEMKKGHFDLKKVVSWRDNVIYFDKTTFEDAIKTLELWYGVEFEIQNRGSNEILVNGEFHKQTLEAVLKSMSYSKFEYVTTGKKVKIKFL